MAVSYSTLRVAVDRAIKDIEDNDLNVTSVEVHGPHTGYRITHRGVGDSVNISENLPWISTPIEK